MDAGFKASETTALFQCYAYYQIGQYIKLFCTVFSALKLFAHSMPDAIIADNGNDNHTGDIIDWKEGTLMLKGILHVGLTVTDLD